ncbi:unnamed protein product [Auanema sp. JU1783]|nr:unnamed protein product [Auanema sp. JU1783]
MSAEKTKNEKIMALLNKKSKQKASGTSNDTKKPTESEDEPVPSTSVSSNEPCTSSEVLLSEEEQRKQELRNKAKSKLLFEAKRAKDRAEQFGPQGWLKPKSLNTNKEFLRRTIQSTVPRRSKKKE